MAAGTMLERLVEDFVDKHGISCPETIYQQDSVIIDAYQFIESLVEIVGYQKEEDEE